MEGIAANTNGMSGQHDEWSAEAKYRAGSNVGDYRLDALPAFVLRRRIYVYT
ncbi:MAG TPA: hypothetical protein VFN53_01150 [Acidobacteriaceae bacterium]|nr:hypothetical protein [Acidobacteriaceae bacterium]